MSMFLLAALCATGISLASWRLRFLRPSGAVAQGLLGFLLLGLGGWAWTIPVVAFFVSASVLSQWADRRSGKHPDDGGRGSTRDAVQVLANGGVAGAIVLGALAWPGPYWYAAFLGAVAASSADTFATELGTTLGGEPRLLTTFQPIPRGMSGGVTGVGLAASVAGAMIVVLAAWWWIGAVTAIAVLGGGVCGSLVDSLLGATLQRTNVCPGCGKVTEQSTHCRGATVHWRGLRWMNNDAVNGCATLAGALLAGFLVWIAIPA